MAGNNKKTSKWKPNDLVMRYPSDEYSGPGKLWKPSKNQVQINNNRAIAFRKQREFINNLKNTGSTGQYAWEEDPINLAKAQQYGQNIQPNPFMYTGGDANTGDYEGTDFNNPLAKWNMGATNNQYGNTPFGSQLGEFQRRFPAGPESNAPPLSKPGMLGKIGSWIGDNPMDVANLGLRLWGGMQQNRAMDQNEQYLSDVRKAMEFDQADVNRRWDLAMGDYKVRQEDQNQLRAAQGMANQYANVGHAKV
jgi:hypothetical protein